MRMGNGKVNPNPCDIDDIRAQFPLIADKIAELEEAVSGGVVDTHKVKVSGADTTEDYLAASTTTLATRDANADALIAAEIGSPAGNETLTYFLDADAVTGHSASGNYSFNLVDGVVQWYDTTNYGGSGSDDKTVKVSAADTTSGYLAASTNDIAVYASGADIVVAAAIASPGADEKLQYFVDVSAISGYANPGHLFWILDDNVSKLATVEYIVTNFLSGNADFTSLVNQIIDASDIAEQFRALRGVYVSGTTTLTIDHIVPLDSGADPRVDDEDPLETLAVSNVPAGTYTVGDVVYADYNAVDELWEARPKVDSESDTATHYYRCVATIPAATSTYAAGWGTAADALSLTDDDTGEEVDPENPIGAVNRWDVEILPDQIVLAYADGRIVIPNCYPNADFWVEPEEE